MTAEAVIGLEMEAGQAEDGRRSFRGTEGAIDDLLALADVQRGSAYAARVHLALD